MDNALRLLKLLREDAKHNSPSGGIRVVRAVTTDPNPLTFVFEGTQLAIDSAVFEIPLSFYPICKNDKFLSAPLVGGNTNRWVLLEKVNNASPIAKMLSASTCQVEGIGRPYGSADLILPSGVPADGQVRALKAGDTVCLLPVKQGGALKYAVIYCF